MKKAKMLAFVFGLMLSVAGVYASSTESFDDYGVVIGACDDPQPVDADCEAGNPGTTCMIGFNPAREVSNCSQILKHL